MDDSNHETFRIFRVKRERMSDLPSHTSRYLEEPSTEYLYTFDRHRPSYTYTDANTVVFEFGAKFSTIQIRRIVLKQPLFSYKYTIRTHALNSISAMVSSVVSLVQIRTKTVQKQGHNLIVFLH